MTKYPMIAARNHGGKQSKVTRIVMHSTVTPCKDGWARKVAGWFHTWTKDASAHYVVDPKEIIKCLADDVVAWHAPPNTGSIGIEQCDYSKGDKWAGGSHVAMLRLSARLAAEKAHEHGVPVTWLTVAELKAGKHGITSHNNVSLAWHQSTHTDPGGFPAGTFMQLVREEYAKIVGHAVKQPATPKITKYWRYAKPMMHGAEAKLIQRKASATADGWYGAKTRAAVKAYQRTHSLTADGVVGPKTARAMGYTWRG